MIADNSLAADEALKISERIKPLLAGHGPDMQGAVLADLVSIWLAGHPAAMREIVLREWLTAVRQLVPVSVMEIKLSRRTGDHDR